MKLSYLLAFGLGYALGHPAGRDRARRVPGQLLDLANRPEVREQVQGIREKSTELAGQAAGRLRRSSTADAADADTGRITPEVTGRRRRLMTRPRRRPGGTEATTGPASSGDPVTDVRSAVLAEPELSPETEAAALGTLPPKTPR